MSMIETPVPQGLDGEPPERLEVTARRALWWSVANNVVVRAGTTLLGIVLARILVPEDYGFYAVALVVLHTLLSLNELGVSNAIVRQPRDLARLAPTVTTLAVGTSAVLWLVSFLCAPVVADALGAPESTTLLRVLTLSLLIDAVTSVPAALMTREFMQRERMIADGLGFVAASVTTLTLALLGHGPWSLVCGALLGNIVNAGFILRYAPRRFAPGFRPDVARELLAFGLPLAFASLLMIAMLNVDYVVVGASLGPAALGFYLLAFNLSSYPVVLFSTPARRVSLPLFARLHAGATDASAAFAPVCTLLLLVTLPACIMLALLAQPFVRIVYGETWVPAAAALPWLMVLGVARVLGELIYDFLVALGSSVTNLVLQSVWLGSLLVALPVAVRMEGIEGVAKAHALVAVAVMGPAYALVLRRAGVSLRAMAGQLGRPILAGVLAALACVGVASVVDGGLFELGIGGSAIVLVYVAVTYPMRTMLKLPRAETA
jgi:O-antigen/teichoic acid export membrane protein